MPPLLASFYLPSAGSKSQRKYTLEGVYGCLEEVGGRVVGVLVVVLPGGLGGRQKLFINPLSD